MVNLVLNWLGSRMDMRGCDGLRCTRVTVIKLELKDFDLIILLISALCPQQLQDHRHLLPYPR